MALLDALTPAELETLELMATAQLLEVNMELAALESCPRPARDLAYGPGILQATYGVRDDLVDLLADATITQYRNHSPKEHHHGTVRT